MGGLVRVRALACEDRDRRPVKDRLTWADGFRMEARARSGRRALIRVLTGSLLVVAAVNGVIGSLAVLSAQARNPSTAFSTGTVVIGDNSGGSTLFTLPAADPGSSASGCVKVTSTGSIGSTIRLYGTATGGLASYITLTVTRGTDSAPSYASCNNFTADGTNYLGSGNGVIYSGTLAAFPSSYAAGVVDPASGSPRTWTQNEAHSYKITATLMSNTAAQGQSATATFTWEARNA